MYLEMRKMCKEKLDKEVQVLREKVLQAEKERLQGVKTKSILEARTELRERMLYKQ